MAISRGFDALFLAHLGDQELGVKPQLLKLCQTVVQNPRFQEAPGSSGKHHGYRGGLFDHTLEVAEAAVAMGLAAKANIPVILTAAVFHDCCKVFEYEFVLDENDQEQIVETEYRKKIRHVAGSFAKFVGACNEGPILNSQYQMEIGHCILAHHGQNDWGSPIEPQTKEAYILHAADMLSARFGPKGMLIK